MLLEFLRGWSPKAEIVPALRQSGALPYAIVNDRVVFLLVTSRRTGRWIFPKGSISNATSSASGAEPRLARLMTYSSQSASCFHEPGP